MRKCIGDPAPSFEEHAAFNQRQSRLQVLYQRLARAGSTLPSPAGRGSALSRNRRSPGHIAGQQYPPRWPGRWRAWRARMRGESMSREYAHLSDEELLRLADGELSSRRAARVNKHLAGCWDCRARLHQFEQSIAHFVDLHHGTLDPRIPPAPGPRALLSARLARLLPALANIPGGPAPRALPREGELSSDRPARPHHHGQCDRVFISCIGRWPQVEAEPNCTPPRAVVFLRVSTRKFLTNQQTTTWTRFRVKRRLFDALRPVRIRVTDL